MPELPEVETVRRTLAPALGATIASVWTSGKGLHMGRKPPRAKLRRLEGKTITALRRIGKYLLVDTDGDDTLMVHLGMSGRFRIVDAVAPRDAHTHVVLPLRRGRARAAQTELRFTDPRRFGQIDIVTRGAERDHAGLGSLGPDPITETLTAEHLAERARGKTTSAKAFILDQSVVAGVGNIYASEALWRAQLHPEAKARRISGDKATAIRDAILEVLTHALEHHGTTLRDFVAADGAEGEHYDYLWVYGRDGQPCRRCERAIVRSVVHGRATFFCPTCQRR
jgi:formamidopyrimidine-DNA glycosylase